MEVESGNTPPLRARPSRSGKPESFLAFLEDRKATDPALLRLENSFAESLLVVTAGSRRHARSLADAIGEFCGENGYEFLGMEGYAAGEWILVDCNDVVINIFLEDTRAQYGLERLWAGRARAAGKDALP